MPTKKSKEIDDLLTSLSGISRQDAAKQEICTWCKQSIGTFKDKLSIREYQISGLCQKCQDNTFVE
jgi:hypothetical protein